MRRERIGNRAQLAIAGRAFRISERQLAERLRLLYEQDQLDPLAIVLGSGSLDEAINGLDGLDRLVSQNESVIEQTRSARRQLSAVSTTLASHQAELARLQASAAGAAALLRQASAERISYIGRARRRAPADCGPHRRPRDPGTYRRGQGHPDRRGPDPPPPITRAAAGAPPSPCRAAGGRTLTVFATGYAPRRDTRRPGSRTGWGVVAVDSGLIPLGTKLSIPGYGSAVAADTGGARARGDDRPFGSRRLFGGARVGPADSHDHA